MEKYKFLYYYYDGTSNITVIYFNGMVFEKASFKNNYGMVDFCASSGTKQLFTFGEITAVCKRLNKELTTTVQ